MNLEKFEDKIVRIIDLKGNEIFGRAEYCWAGDSAEGFEQMVDRLIIDDESTGETVAYLSETEISSIEIIE